MPGAWGIDVAPPRVHRHYNQALSSSTGHATHRVRLQLAGATYVTKEPYGGVSVDRSQLDGTPLRLYKHVEEELQDSRANGKSVGSRYRPRIAACYTGHSAGRYAVQVYLTSSGPGSWLLGRGRPRRVVVLNQAKYMETETAIDLLRGNLKASGADIVAKVQGVFRFCIGKKTWTVDLANGAGEVFEGEPEGVEPDATLTMTDDTFINLIMQKSHPQMAFLSRKLKIKGSISKALKVVHVLEFARKPASKL